MTHSARLVARCKPLGEYSLQCTTRPMLDRVTAIATG